MTPVGRGERMCGWDVTPDNYYSNDISYTTRNEKCM